MRLALIQSWVEAVSWQTCFIVPLKWDYQTPSDGHSSGSSQVYLLVFQEPTIALSKFCELQHSEHIQMCRGNRQPASRAAVTAPAQISLGPWNGGMQHFSSQWVRVLLCTTTPLPNHTGAQHAVVAT